MNGGNKVVPISTACSKARVCTTEIVGNIVSPTSTATPLRVCLFDATKRPKIRCNQWIETSWGSCRVKGRLGQRHEDVLDSMLYVAEDKRKDEGGGLLLLIDPAKLRRCLSDGRHKAECICSWIEDIINCTVEIHTPRINIIGHLIDYIKLTAKPIGYDPVKRSPRFLWVVRLGLALCQLLDQDYHLYYDPRPIARLRHGISQAVARLVLSHRDQPAGGWILDSLIEKVSGPVSNNLLRQLRLRIRSDEQTLTKLGINLDGDRVFANNAASQDPRAKALRIPPVALRIPPGALRIPPATLRIPPGL